MNKVIGNIMMVIGFICLLSAVGNEDACASVGIYYSFLKIVLWIVVGFGSMAGGFAVKHCRD